MYTNADMLYFDDLPLLLKNVGSTPINTMMKYCPQLSDVYAERLVMVGRRIDVTLPAELAVTTTYTPDFLEARGLPGQLCLRAMQRVRDHARLLGVTHDANGIDFFLFHRSRTPSVCHTLRAPS